MAKATRRGWILAALLLLGAAAEAKDAKGAKDHPLVGRLAGSELVVSSAKKFDAFSIPLGPAVTSGDRFAFEKSLRMEGSVLRLTYIAPEGVGPEEVLGNYRELFQKKGFEVLFEGKGGDLGTYDSFFKAGGYDNVFQGNEESQRFLAGKLSRPEGSCAVMVYAVENTFWSFEIRLGGREVLKGRTYYRVDVVEENPLQSALVVVQAGEMARRIAQTGRVALYGILFDTDKADIKTESRPALDEIARLLTEDRALTLRVVGHTDNEGGFEHNVDLSRRRAAAVVRALVQRYGIDGKRLTPYGVGMLAPVASNETEKGRTQNRRVELVKP